jgi:pimeloyl-ACP methyl ester carboxylesterase
VVEARRIDGRAVTFRHDAGMAPALVCTHGAADNHHVHDRLLDALPTYERYAIDFPGRVGTDGPPLGTVVEMEIFLSRFVDSEVEGGYVVVGHSLGGGVAIQHALTFPSRLKAIVLVASGARLRVHPMIFRVFEEAEQRGGLPPLPPGLFEPGAHPDLVAEASRHRELTPTRTGVIDWGAADRFDRMKDLHAIRVPALIVAGTRDPLTPPKYAEYLAAHIPDSELHVLDGAGHMLTLERPSEVAAHIERFLSTRMGPSSASRSLQPT